MFNKGQVVTIKESHKNGIICDKIDANNTTLYQIKVDDTIKYAVEADLCQTTLIYD